MRALIVAAALLGLLLVAAGAAGGHTRCPSTQRARWQSAFLYGFVHTLAAIVAAILPFRSRLQIASGWAFIAERAAVLGRADRQDHAGRHRQ